MANTSDEKQGSAAAVACRERAAPLALGVLLLVVSLFPAAPATALPQHDVEQAQTRLQTLGYDPGARDGALGGKTIAALKKFQADQGLAATGKLDPRTLAALAEAVDWARTADKDSPGGYWEFNQEHPGSDRVRVMRGPFNLKFAYVNLGNGMEPMAEALVEGVRYSVSTQQVGEWRFFRYLHSGSYLVPISGGGIADATVILAKTPTGEYKISDVQGEVAGGGADPFHSSLQSNAGTFRAADHEWQLERAPRVMGWEQAKSYCTGLDLASGGWRLPTYAELSALYREHFSIPGYDSNFEAVSAIGVGRYWTIAAVAGGKPHAIELDFNSGKNSDDPVGYRYNVRCVR